CRRLCCHRRHRADGGGAAGRADHGRQPAGTHDPRAARAGACAGPGCSRTDDRVRPGLEELRLMARINLLPWRAERRRQRQKEAMVMLGLSALCAVLLSVLIIFFYYAQIDGQQERNAYLTAQIEEVKKQNVEIDELDEKKARLLARKEVIER